MNTSANIYGTSEATYIFLVTMSQIIPLLPQHHTVMAVFKLLNNAVLVLAAIASSLYLGFYYSNFPTDDDQPSLKQEQVTGMN